METLMLKREVEPMLVSLGRFIRQKRMSLGLSQEELADRAGLHRTYISDVERGIRNLTIGAAWFIAHGLGLQLKDMISALEYQPNTSIEIPSESPSYQTTASSFSAVASGDSTPSAY